MINLARGVYAPLALTGENFMKDIKVVFKGVFAPSGKRTNVEYMVGKARLEQWKKYGKFDIEILEKPKPQAKPKKEKAKD